MFDVIIIPFSLISLFAVILVISTVIIANMILNWKPSWHSELKECFKKDSSKKYRLYYSISKNEIMPNELKNMVEEYYESYDCNIYTICVTSKNADILYSHSKYINKSIDLSFCVCI